MARDYVVGWCDVWQLLQDFSETYQAEITLQFSVKPGTRKDAILEVVVVDRMSASGLQECGRWRYPVPRKESTQVAALVLFYVNQTIHGMRTDPWSMPTLLRRELVPEAD